MEDVTCLFSTSIRFFPSSMLISTHFRIHCFLRTFSMEKTLVEEYLVIFSERRKMQLAFLVPVLDFVLFFLSPYLSHLYYPKYTFLFHGVLPTEDLSKFSTGNFLR